MPHNGGAGGARSAAASGFSRRLRQLIASGAWTHAEDRLGNGRRFQALLVKDEATADCLGLPVQPSFNALDVERELDARVARHGAPRFVRCDNGGPFIAFTVQRWADRRGVRMAHIEPGKPWQNGAARELGGDRPARSARCRALSLDCRSPSGQRAVVADVQRRAAA